jgi:hypothetical protein
MNSSTQIAPRQNTYGVVTLGVLAVAIVATGVPDAETAAWLTERGVPAALSTPAMYVLPVLAILASLLVARALGRGRSPVVRWSLYAGLGAVGGFVMGLCLDLFAAVPNIIAAITGPLAEPTLLDTLLWVLGGLCLVLGLMVGGIALFGQSAVTALQVEEVSDPECLEVRRAERGVFAWSAVGMITLGLACCALAVTRQADETVRLAPAIVGCVMAIVSVVASYVLWRGFDEMQRRHVIDGYASSAIVATLGGFAWAILEGLGHVEPISATGVFLVLIFVQLLVTSYVTSSVMGQMSMIGKPA